MNKPKFEFIEETHTYLLDGVKIPSVTSVLPYNYIGNTDYQKLLGKYIHAAIEMYEHNNLDVDSLDQAIFPYFESYRKIDLPLDTSQIWDYKTGKEHPCTELQLAAYQMLVKEGVDINGIAAIDLPPGKYPEIRLYHPIYRFAGSIDYYYKHDSNHTIKTYAIYLSPTGDKPLLKTGGDYKLNIAFFMSFLTTYKWMQEHKINKR